MARMRKHKRDRVKRTRRRPHNDDFLLGMFQHTVAVPPTGLTVFALAMCWAMWRDRLRLQSLMNLRPDARVLTMSENASKARRQQHISHHFHTVKGQTVLAQRITVEKDLRPLAEVVVVVDYYWLATGYLQARYGLALWLRSGIRRVLQAGATTVLFPNDNGKLNRGDRCLLTALEAGMCPSDLSWSFCGHADNVLWLASNSAAIAPVLASTPGGDNTMNTDNYLDPVHPFVCFKLRGNVAS